MKKIFLACAVACLVARCACAAPSVKLPEPRKSGGAPLLDCLSMRRAGREFSGKPLSDRDLSDLLWAAGGVSSPEGKLTYPTALDVRDLAIYAVTADGAYRYDPAAHEAVPVATGDLRAATGEQPFAARASVDLVYVQDLGRWRDKKASSEAATGMGFVHAGAAAQNASLFAASKGWSSVVRASFDRAALARVLNLGENERILLAHSIGPKP